MDLLERHRLELLARDLAAGADQLRAVVGGLRDGAASSNWRSPAGRAFAVTLETVLFAAARLATRLDDTAGLARSHGQRVAVLAERAAETARATERTVASAADRMLPW